MKRRHFIQTSSAALLTGCGNKEPLSHAIPLTLSNLIHRIAVGELTSLELMQYYLDRIHRLDRAGPELRSVIELHPDAIAMAKVSDRLKRKGSLYGAPILIKDNIDTADAMLTTAGSLSMMDAPKPRQDAEIVRRLRAAGALVFGKTNLSEWANIRSNQSTSGWSARGGLTRNPHKLTHSASGSSSGSAVAVAAGFCAAAIGTETNGSIISPASSCGIVGLKPTLGSISCSGIIPITHWQDTAGPMTLTVRDAALLMDALSEKSNHTSLMKPDVLRGVRLGIVRELCGDHRGVLSLFDQAIETLRQAGAVIIDSVLLPNHHAAGGWAWKAMLTEFRSDLNAYLKARGGKMRSLADVIAFNLAHRESEMPYFGQETFEKADLRSTPEAISEARVARTLASRLAGPEGIDAALRNEKLDALICPTNDPIQRITLDQGDVDVRCACGPSAVAGYPHLTVPLGMVDGLPVGFSFFGAAWKEPELLAYGDAFEKLMPARVTPALLGVAAKSE